MADLKGKGLVWAVAGVTFSAGITVSANESALFQNQRFQRSSDSSLIKGIDGEVSTKAVHNKKKTFTLAIVPAGVAVSDAKSLMDKFLLAPGTKVTLADPDSGVVDAVNNFIVNTSTLTRTVDGAAAVELELEQFETNDISTSAA